MIVIYRNKDFDSYINFTVTNTRTVDGDYTTSYLTITVYQLHYTCICDSVYHSGLTCALTLMLHHYRATINMLALSAMCNKPNNQYNHKAYKKM